MVNRQAFTLIVGFAVAASPLAAQFNTPAGYDLVGAIKKRDGDKATQILDTRPKGIVNTKDAEGNTGLLIAINRNDEQWTAFLLNRGADPNLAGKGGDTPLIAAARVGFGTAAQWLISLNAKVDGTNKMGETPLIIAVQQREVPMVRILLAAGADPDKSDSAAGYSARDYATRDPRARDILKLITDKKPKASSAN